MKIDSHNLAVQKMFIPRLLDTQHATLGVDTDYGLGSFHRQH